MLTWTVLTCWSKITSSILLVEFDLLLLVCRHIYNLFLVDTASSFGREIMAYFANLVSLLTNASAFSHCETDRINCAWAVVLPLFFRHTILNSTLSPSLKLLFSYLLMPSAYSSYYFSKIRYCIVDNVLPCLFDKRAAPRRPLVLGSGLLQCAA